MSKRVHQQNFSDLDSNEQIKIQKQLMWYGKYMKIDFNNFLSYLLLQRYIIGESDLEPLLKITAEAKPEFIQQLLNIQNDTYYDLEIGEKLILRLFINNLNPLRDEINKFVTYYTNDNQIQLNSPSDYWFIDKVFQKAFQLWVNPEKRSTSQLRSNSSTNSRKLLMDIPSRKREIQSMTKPIEQREVTLVGTKSKKERLIIEELDEENDENENNFEDPQPVNSNEKFKEPEEIKITVSDIPNQSHESVSINDQSGDSSSKQSSDLKGITFLYRKPKILDFSNRNLRLDNFGSYFLSLRNYEMRQRLMERRKQILEENRKNKETKK